MMPRLMKKNELAKHLGVSCATIYRWDKEGKIPPPVLKSNNMALYDVIACEAALGIATTTASA